MDDQMILMQFNLRSEQALVETRTRYGAYCRRIAMGILNDEDDSAEVVNDVLLKAWNTIPPRNPKSLCSYLGMLSRQIAIDRWRGRRGEFALSLDELAEVVPSTDLRVEQIDLRDALNEFLSALTPDARLIFLWRYWWFCSVEEIARSRGMTEGAVKMSLSRTRAKLKTFLKEEQLYETD